MPSEVTSLLRAPHPLTRCPKNLQGQRTRSSRSVSATKTQAQPSILRTLHWQLSFPFFSPFSSAPFCAWPLHRLRLGDRFLARLQLGLALPLAPFSSAPWFAWSLHRLRRDDRFLASRQPPMELAPFFSAPWCAWSLHRLQLVGRCPSSRQPRMALVLAPSGASVQWMPLLDRTMSPSDQCPTSQHRQLRTAPSRQGPPTAQELRLPVQSQPVPCQKQLSQSAPQVQKRQLTGRRLEDADRRATATAEAVACCAGQAGPIDLDFFFLQAHLRVALASFSPPQPPSQLLPEAHLVPSAVSSARHETVLRFRLRWGPTSRPLTKPRLRPGKSARRQPACPVRASLEPHTASLPPLLTRF
mmetsp:Transcript_28401/g.74973  ORF Transcript_28401/g.74973 Transcript_28401/m.74973 type:complete len:357 (+) Transcript_28401:1387-2457(+)